MAGLLLKNRDVPPSRKVVWLLAAGAAGVLLGLLWSVQFPLIKRIWTSSFILVTSGASALLLAIFYYIVDVKQCRKWCQPFVWIGCNALIIYVTAQVVGFKLVAARLAGGDVKDFFDARLGSGVGDLVIALVSLLLVFLFARFLYKRSIFLRV
jgi:predicted acyltransferase